MIVEGIAVVGVVAAVYEYFHNASFKADVAAEVSALKTKAKNGVAIVEADFAKVETLVGSLVSKL